MKLTNETRKRIRKYAKLRKLKILGVEIPINKSYRTLRDLYIAANDTQRKVFEKDMENYFKAVNDGVIKPGESYVFATLGSMQVEVEK